MTHQHTVFLDCETTGLHAARRPWEIAMVLECERDGALSTDSILIHINDIDLSEADPMALRIGRFYERHCRARLAQPLHAEPVVREPGVQALSEQTAAEVVEAWTRGAKIVGACPWFDTETLEPMLRLYGLAPSWSHRLRDVEALTEGHLGRDVGGLRQCAEALGLPVDKDKLHTAMGDALLARDIYHAVMAPVLVAA